MALNRLTGLDAIFLAAESQTNPMHMMAIMLLDPRTNPGAYSFEGMRDFIASRLPILPPLRRRLVEVPFGLDRPTWVEEADIDIDYHIRRAAVPSPGGPQELAALASRVNERLLDRSRPLWEMLLVEGLEDGNIALVAKLQHAMMDGFAGVKLMASLVSSSPEVKVLDLAVEPDSERIPTALEMLARAIPSIATRPARSLRAAAHAAQIQLRAALEERNRGGDDEPEIEELEVGRCVLNSAISSRRGAAYTSLPMAELKRVGAATDATLNEVLLTILAGSLRQYLDARDLLPELPLVAGVPISTHSEDDDEANSYSSLFASLATDIEDPIERMRLIQQSCRRAKRQHGAGSGDLVKEVVDIPAPWVMGMAATAYSKLGIAEAVKPLCNLIVSNVPGPPTDLYFGGAKLVGLHPLGPIFEGMALNITAISVGDTLDLGLVACQDVVPDLWELADSIRSGLDELLDRIDEGDA